jgi:8-oxo-dGTP diphosphatase
MDLLVQLKEVQTNVSHRPAKLFKFDETRYRQLRKEGFAFDLSVKSA